MKMNQTFKKLSYLTALFISVQSLSSLASTQKCYQLSQTGTSFSRTPELLCVASQESGGYQITLETGLSMNRRVVAKFNYDLLKATHNANRNENVFGLSNPSNSIFNNMKIRFDGRMVESEDGEKVQKGTVSIGTTTFYYRMR